MSSSDLHFRQCLTWDPSSPAPYESGWSVLSKVLLINHLTATELFALIHKEGAKATRQGSLNHLYSDWIDLTKLATLLGIETERVEQCFLDTLGFTSKTVRKNGIRHCPECARLGYHCVMFNLAVVEFCPWHNRQLEQLCTSCLRSISYSRNREMRSSLAFECKKCHLGVIDCRILDLLERTHGNQKI